MLKVGISTSSRTVATKLGQVVNQEELYGEAIGLRSCDFTKP